MAYFSQRDWEEAAKGIAKLAWWLGVTLLSAIILAVPVVHWNLNHLFDFDRHPEPLLLSLDGGFVCVLLFISLGGLVVLGIYGYSFRWGSESSDPARDRLDDLLRR